MDKDNQNWDGEYVREYNLLNGKYDLIVPDVYGARERVRKYIFKFDNTVWTVKHDWKGRKRIVVGADDPSKITEEQRMECRRLAGSVEVVFEWNPYPV